MALLCLGKSRTRTFSFFSFFFWHGKVMLETNICLKEICLMPLVLSQKDEKRNKVHHSLPKSLQKVLQKCLENWHGLNFACNFMHPKFYSFQSVNTRKTNNKKQTCKRIGSCSSLGFAKLKKHTQLSSCRSNSMGAIEKPTHLQMAPFGAWERKGIWMIW